MPRRPPSVVTGDRNVRALREHQHTQFVERVRAGLAQPLDRFRDPIGIGDLVLLTPELLPLTGEVHSIEAVALAQQPPDASAFVQVMLTFSVPAGGHVEYPMLPLIIKKKKAEWKPDKADEETAVPPADDSPPAEPPDDHTD